MNKKCNEDFKKIFFPNKTNFYNEIEEIIYITKGKLVTIPPSTFYNYKLSNLDKKKKINSNSRGLDLSDTNDINEYSQNYQYYWEKFLFKYSPSVNALRTYKVLNKFKSEISNKFIGIAVSDLPKTNFSKNDQNYFLNNLNEIPFAKREIQQIAINWGIENSTTLINEQATKSNIKKLSISRPRILSLATHAAKIEKNNLSRTPFLLIFPNKNFDIDSFFLTPEDIIEYNLNAQIVILSACETYDANLDSNIYSKSLASAFLYNSSDSVLLSLWLIDDEATFIMMSGITKKIKSNPSMKLDQAIRQTIPELIKKGFDHPFYWGGFLVVGE